MRLFEKWLQIPENFEEFQVNLLAYLTLVFEKSPGAPPSVDGQGGFASVYHKVDGRPAWPLRGDVVGWFVQASGRHA